MITFKSLDDLSKLPPDHPAYPVIKDLAQKLLVTTASMARPYDPEADGYLVLIEESDIDRVLNEIWDDFTLLNAAWEGISKLISKQHNFYIAIFIGAGDFGLVFAIPDEAWLPVELRKVLEGNLVPEAGDLDEAGPSPTTETPTHQP
jgi:hypothetical protein